MRRSVVQLSANGFAQRHCFGEFDFQDSHDRNPAYIKLGQRRVASHGVDGFHYQRRLARHELLPANLVHVLDAVVVVVPVVVCLVGFVRLGRLLPEFFDVLYRLRAATKLPRLRRRDGGGEGAAKKTHEEPDSRPKDFIRHGVDKLRHGGDRLHDKGHGDLDPHDHSGYERRSTHDVGPYFRRRIAGDCLDHFLPAGLLAPRTCGLFCCHCRSFSLALAFFDVRHGSQHGEVSNSVGGGGFANSWAKMA
mmetsp:Transcript_22832/g.63797  ORF Transcript_22832/g.63797 Transcript_22832/m.63797 type:complete len:249 (+) Transcript_22832:491-1237(+)